MHKALYPVLQAVCEAVSSVHKASNQRSVFTEGYQVTAGCVEAHPGLTGLHAARCLEAHAGMIRQSLSIIMQPLTMLCTSIASHHRS